MHNQKNYSEVHPLLARLEGVRASHGDLRWMALCPAHADSVASLSLRLNGNKLLVHCFAGCTAEEVVAAAGLTMRDLFPRGRASEGWRPGPSFDIDHELMILGFAEFYRLRDEPLTPIDAARLRRARKLLARWLDGDL